MAYRASCRCEPLKGTLPAAAEERNTAYRSNANPVRAL